MAIQEPLLNLVETQELPVVKSKEKLEHEPLRRSVYRCIGYGALGLAISTGIIVFTPEFQTIEDELIARASFFSTDSSVEPVSIPLSIPND